ncbi:MAG: M1 family metallopeptidase [Nocardioidaceae bacterium]
MRTQLIAAATAAALLTPLGSAEAVVAGPGGSVGLDQRGPRAYPHAISHPRRDPYYPAEGSPSIDTLHYGLSLTWLRGARVLRGVESIRFRVPHDESRLRLDLGRPLAVSSATLDGRHVTTRHIGSHLFVRPGRLHRDQRHTLRIVYAGTPRPIKAPVSRGDFSTTGWTTLPDGQTWTMQEPFGALTWYPVNDHPSDKAYYDVRVSAPHSWVGVFNGQMTKRFVRNGRTVTRWHLGSPAASYLTTMAIGPYREYHQVGPHGLPLTYWVRPVDRRALQVLRQSPTMLRWLEAHLGRYPFDRAGAVVMPSDSAMETQTLVSMGNSLVRYPTLFRSDLLHEYSHAWYGDTVTPDNWPDLWMNESFAMYIQLVWEIDQGWMTRARMRSDLNQQDQVLRNMYGPPGAYYRHDFASGNVYYCGARMLDRLRTKLGPAVFARLLRQWPQTHRFSNGDRSEWIDWLNQQTGRHLRPFVHRWLTLQRSPR